MSRVVPFPTPRRQFLKALGAAGLAVPLGPLAASFAQVPQPPAAGAAAPDSSRGVPPPPPASTEPSEDARALAAIIHRRFPHLNAEQIQSIARDFEGDLGSGKRLRAVKLANGDEPDTIFRAEG